MGVVGRQPLHKGMTSLQWVSSGQESVKTLETICSKLQYVSLMHSQKLPGTTVGADNIFSVILPMLFSCFNSKVRVNYIAVI